jgi:hypothetical protein
MVNQDEYRSLLDDDALQMDSEKLDQSDPGILRVFAELAPSRVEGFRSVTIMGANIKFSLLWQAWSGQVQFKPHPLIGQDPRYQMRFTQHRGELAQIHCANIDGFSKRFRDRDQNLSLLLDWALGLIPQDQPFIYLANTDVENLERGIRLDHNCHGLNTFQDVSNCLFLSAQNLNPSYQGWLNRKGINKDRVRTAINAECAYQFVLRSALRDPDNTKPVCIIVPDRTTAYFLYEMLPGSDVIEHDVFPAESKSKPNAGRPMVENPRPDAVRKRAYRAKRKMGQTP